MEPESIQRIKISNEGDFNSLLGALIRELPDVFEVEILSKLSVKDHLALAQVNKECRDVVYKIPSPLGALIRELPDVFEAEVLTKLSLKDHLALAQVNKACKDVVYKIPPLQFLRSKRITCHNAFEFMRMCRYYPKHFRAFSQRLYQTAEMGRLDVLKWVWEREPSCRKFVLQTVYKAGLHGHKEMLDWFYTLPREDFPQEGLTEQEVKAFPNLSKALNGAAEGGHLELVKHLREKGCEWDESTCAAAAQEGHVHVLEHLRTNDCPWDEESMAYAASEGQLDTLKWLHEHGCPWDEESMPCAARAGKFASLKWLHEHGCPGWDEYTFAAAASGGNLEMIKWMHDNGCPWDEGATEQAAVDDNLEILKWLHENGCQISDEACSEAANSEAWECLTYLVDNKCPNWEVLCEYYEDIIPEWVKLKQRG